MNRTTIVLVSADVSVTKPVSRCLEEAGYKVLHSNLGGYALWIIQTERPALIILDWGLPDVNSLATLRAIRDGEQTANLPVILLGTKMHEEEVLLGLEIGADLCLVEVFHPQVFVARVRSLLRRTEPLKLY